MARTAEGFEVFCFLGAGRDDERRVALDHGARVTQQSDDQAEPGHRLGSSCESTWYQLSEQLNKQTMRTIAEEVADDRGGLVDIAARRLAHTNSR